MALGGLVLIPTANILSSLIVDGAIACALYMYVTKWKKKDGEDN